MLLQSIKNLTCQNVIGIDRCLEVSQRMTFRMNALTLYSMHYFKCVTSVVFLVSGNRLRYSLTKRSRYCICSSSLVWGQFYCSCQHTKNIHAATSLCRKKLPVFFDFNHTDCVGMRNVQEVIDSLLKLKLIWLRSFLTFHRLYFSSA